MSIRPKKLEQDLILLGKLTEQQKKEGTIKIKTKLLRQTHDKKLAESFEPITKNSTDVNYSTEKPGKVFERRKYGTENRQEIVLIENDSDNSEDENGNLI